MQNKKLILILAVLIGVIFISINKMKIKNKTGETKNETKVVKPSESVVKDENGIDCMVYKGVQPVINETSKYIDVIHTAHIEGVFTVQKVKFKEDKIELSYKDSFCNGYFAEIEISPFIVNNGDLWFNKAHEILRRPIYSQRGEHWLRTLRGLHRNVTKTPESQKSIEWECGYGRCRMMRKDNVVTVVYLYQNKFEEPMPETKEELEKFKNLPLAPL